MSIFDLHDDNFLLGDKNARRVKKEVLEYEHFKKDAAGEEIFQERPKTFRLPYFFCLLVFTILIWQLLRLQIAQGSFNRNLAEGNRVRIREIEAPRSIRRERLLA